MSNIYVLCIKLDNNKTIQVGALREIEFAEGYYAYIGSARSKNFTRVKRHFKISTGQKQTTHWHIDYLNADPDATITKAYAIQNAQECNIAQRISLDEIDKFGSSDCSCKTHLKYHTDKKQFFKQVKDGISNYSHKTLQTEDI